jgi:dihydropyrimidinase
MSAHAARLAKRSRSRFRLYSDGSEEVNKPAEGLEAMPSVLIQNGTVVNADSTVQADVLIEGTTIKEVRSGIPAGSVETVVDACGLLLLPGGIDAHTHLDMPFGGSKSADDFETGTRAAAIGGTTTIVDFAIQARGTKMRTALDTWWKKAEGKACIDYGLHMIVTDLGDAGLEDMDDMVREGVASFKLFMAYPNVLMVDDATIFKALRQTAKNGALICMHAENGSVIDVLVQQALAEGKTAPIYHALTRPTRAEAEAVHRAIAMAEIAGVPVYIVHLSSEDALNQVREARDRGLPAFAETCPQYLLLSLEDVQDKGWEGAKYVFTPPLREKKNQPKLWEGLRKDNLQVVSTDHCPFCFEDQKALGKDDFTKIPNGGPGIENRLQLLHHHGVGLGNLSLNRFVELVSTAPARIFGMYPKKGVLAAGSDADIVLWDPIAAHTISAATHHMRVDYSMFEGFHVRGNARDVYSRGELIVSKGKFIGTPGRGKYLRREARGGAWK